MHGALVNFVLLQTCTNHKHVLLLPPQSYEVGFAGVCSRIRGSAGGGISTDSLRYVCCSSEIKSLLLIMMEVEAHSESHFEFSLFRHRGRRQPVPETCFRSRNLVLKNLVYDCLHAWDEPGTVVHVRLCTIQATSPIA